MLHTFFVAANKSVKSSTCCAFESIRNYPSGGIIFEQLNSRLYPFVSQRLDQQRSCRQEKSVKLSLQTSSRLNRDPYDPSLAWTTCGHKTTWAQVSFSKFNFIDTIKGPPVSRSALHHHHKLLSRFAFLLIGHTTRDVDWKIHVTLRPALLIFTSSNLGSERSFQ